MDNLKEEKVLAIAAAEQRWEKAWKQQCWDALDDCEDEIAKLTGETDVQVNRRLAEKMKSHNFLI